MRYSERWGRLLNRYREERPMKLLAIDGGGIRGLISVGYAEEDGNAAFRESGARC
jgi:hypothetical protein